MPPVRHRTALALIIPLALVVAACSSGGGASAGPTSAPSVAPSSSGGRGANHDYGGGAASPSTTASVEPSAAGLEIGTGTGPLGTYLTDPDGMTLYIFTNDAANTAFAPTPAPRLATP